MRTHISRTVSNCFAVLRQIRSIRRSLTRPVLQSLVVSLVMPRLDYGNATLAGLPDNQLSRLQSVLNAAARLVFSTRKHEPVSPLLRDLHWLPVPQGIEFKLAVLELYNTLIILVYNNNICTYSAKYLVNRLNYLNFRIIV